ncbi:MAG TPA: LytR C-terminal domain-containing protein [Patescibacteria group bacterium]|nr:LytR C-terminal domain-containing protein [Patescibacteria group bacterium]
MPKDEKDRKRMVVEEVPVEVVEDKMPLDEVKEKVEELQDITQDIGESVEKSAEVQEEIVKAAEKVEPSVQQPEMRPLVSNKGPGVWIILVPGILLLGALLGGIVFYQRSLQSGSEPTPTASPATEATMAPSASPSAKLDLTKYPINVQNGSGIPGTASSAKDLLIKAGFKVSSAGNAATYDYTDTIIEVKSDVPADFISKLKTTLSGIYSLGTSKTLPDSSKDEVVVIVGSSKAQ